MKIHVPTYTPCPQNKLSSRPFLYQWSLCHNRLTKMDTSLSNNIQLTLSLFVLHNPRLLTNVTGHISTILVSYRTVSLPPKSSVCHVFISPTPKSTGNHCLACSPMRLESYSMESIWGECFWGPCSLSSVHFHFLHVFW